ncbi:MAG TPA: hypothetical protein DDW27_17590 [Bacteroidales bacterium]|nr:hypothetical protein [Bacteroidales bacterium]
MKKLILITALILIAGSAFCQLLQKGNFIGLNDAGNAAMSRIQPLLDQLTKLGTSTFKYTDWIIQ